MDLRQYRFNHKPHVRISYSMQMEERLAAAHCGYTWEQYLTLPGADWWIDPTAPTDSKASVIAFYRADNLMKAVVNDPPKKGKK